MAIFNNSYSGLITGGLGGSACCSMLTIGFHLFKCTISVVPPPPTPTGGSGGGPYVSSGFYVPFPKALTQSTKMVLITVKLGEKSWRRSYVVDRYKADAIIKISKFVNASKSKLTIGIQAVKAAKARVTAIFNHKDK